MNWLRSLAALRNDLPRLIPLMRSSEVPTWSKVLAILAALFVVSPLNLLGDLPLAGFLDDGILLGLIVHRFVSFAERRTATAARPA